MTIANLILDLIMALCGWFFCGFFALSLPDKRGLRFDTKLAEYIGVALFPLAIIYLYTIKTLINNRVKHANVKRELFLKARPRYRYNYGSEKWVFQPVNFTNCVAYDTDGYGIAISTQK